MANVLPHAGQDRTSRPSFTPAMATGGGASSSPTSLNPTAGPRGTLVVSFGTWKICRQPRQRIFFPRTAGVVWKSRSQWGQARISKVRDLCGGKHAAR